MQLTVAELQTIVQNRLCQAVYAWTNDQNTKNGQPQMTGWGPAVKLEDAIQDMDDAWAELKKELER